MVDFYTVEEPLHKPERHDHMHGLELTMAQYYSTLLSKIMNHVNDSDVHVTAEEKESWNNKADKSTVDSIKEIVDESKDTIDNIDDTIQKYIKQYLNSDNFDTTILNNYATIKYVNDQLSKINGYDIIDYAKKDWVNQNFVKVGSIPTFDSSKYYTKSEIDNKITSTGISYAITDFAFRDGKLSIVQENGINTSINIGTGSNTGVTEEDITSALSSYLKKGSLGTITFTRNGSNVLKWSPEEGSANIDISGTGGGGSGSDGGTYVPYFKLWTSRTELPASQKPTLGQDPELNGWKKNVAPNADTFHYVWMTQVLIKAGSFLEFTEPFCITGNDGDPGSDVSAREFIYKRTATEIRPNSYTGTEPWGSSSFSDGWTDNPQGVTDTLTCEWVMYRTMDKDNVVSEWKPSTGPVLWSHYGHNGTDGDGVEYIFASLKPNETTALFVDDEDPTEWDSDADFQKKYEYIRPASKLWKDDPIDIATANGYGEGSKTYVSMRKRKGSNGTPEDDDARWSKYSQPALWSYMAKSGDGGSQTLAGSPLRNKGKYTPGTMYRDGHTESENGVFWQDFVEHDNSYYVCITQNDNVTPGTNEAYWQLMSYTESMFTNLLLAKKAAIGELTTNEVICTDNNSVVAGMTSSNTSLATSAGNVRIWAGSTETGNIQSAPFTVTDKGVLTCAGANGTIRIEDGTIWFIKDGYKYYLTIDDTTHKPNWTTGKGATGTAPYYKLTGNTSGDVSVSSQLLYNFDGVWYSDAQMNNKVSGTYYKGVASDAITRSGSYNFINTGISTSSQLNNIYVKTTFNQGVPTELGLVATTRVINYSSDTKATMSTGYKWATISSGEQNTNNFYCVKSISNNMYAIISKTSDITFDNSSTFDNKLYYLTQSTLEQVAESRIYSRVVQFMQIGSNTVTIKSTKV